MLDRLVGYGWYCFLNRYLVYNKICIIIKDQEKTTFICPYGAFAFKRMPFGRCYAPATFHWRMLSVFSNME